MSLANNILDAIDILADNKVSSVQFDKTVRGSIYDVVDESIGKYKVKYQNSVFFAYALDLKTYSKGTQVYIVIPSSDFEKDPYILGTVKKIGMAGSDVLTNADRMSLLGTNIFTMSTDIGFCSYKTNDSLSSTIDLLDDSNPLLQIDETGLALYKQDSDYLLIGATFKTKLDNIQKVGSGNYGIRVECTYYDARYTEEVKKSPTTPRITRIYELGVNNMVGNPYNFTVPNEQTVLFEIDSNNLVSIDKVEAFCENFPNSKQGDSQTNCGYFNPEDKRFYSDPEFTKRISFGSTLYIYDLNSKQWYRPITSNNVTTYENATDIILSNLVFEFYDALTEDEIQGLSLRITTPYGNYFYTNSQGEDKPDTLTLHGELRIKGKKVNYNEQPVNFYWFVKDGSVMTSTDQGYSKYGGPGWRCLNTEYNSTTTTDEETGKTVTTGYAYAADIHNKLIPISLCPALKTEFKCVAIFKDGTETSQISNTTVLYNRTKDNVADITLDSSMGTNFDFNEGITTLTCYVNGQTAGDAGFDPSKYKFYWTRSIDAGGSVPYNPEGATPMQRPNVTISDAYRFVTYECTVKKLIEDEEGNIKEIDFGSAAITLNNGEPTGQYTLILNNGTQVFKYNKDGVSPASLSLDEFDRMAIPILSFDIYNDKGQLVTFSSNEEKIKRMKIRWVWPNIGVSSSSKGPIKDDPANLTSMLNPGDNYTFTSHKYTDPSTNSIISRWVIADQAEISFGIANTYDLSKYDNNIGLEVEYNGQKLKTSTNFTFVKDGELGTNGTTYLTRIVPIDSYEKIVIKQTGTDIYRIGGLKSNETGGKSFVPFGKNSSDAVTPFKVEIWDGGTTPYRTIEAKHADVTWSTSLTDRNNEGLGNNEVHLLKLNSVKDGTFSINAKNNGYYKLAENYTVKAAVTDQGKTYYASYPLEIYLGNYYVEGGYRNCNYQSDGTRSFYNQQPFTIKNLEYGSIVEGIWTNNWDGKISLVNNNPNYILIEPPATYDGSNIHNYVTCKVNDTIVAYIPIELYLDRYGLSAVQGWDGSSIKLNTTGSNYILSPQIGAGTNDSNGFTGITMGKAMDNDGTKIGLFGYHQGQRSIFLDSETGNAEFGKIGKSQIKIDATSNEGTIASGNYPNGGMKIKFSNTGSGTELGPYIKYSSGHFSVDSNGNITAKGGGTIAGWNISDNQLSSNNGAVYLNSAATGNGIMFKAGSNFSVQADGTITATDGTIAGWNITGSEIKNTAIFMHKDGYIGGGTGGAYNNIKGHNNLRWYIDSNGVAHFSDLQINNNTSKTTQTAGTKIINLTKTNGNEGFWVKNDGSMKATSVDITGKVVAETGDIGGWTIDSSGIHRGNFKLNNSGNVNMGANFTFDGDGGSGKVASGSGSNLKSGHVYGGGSGSGGAGTDWKDVNVVYSITASTTNNFPTYTDSEGKPCTASGGTKFVYKVTYNTRRLRLLVDGETSDQSHDA